MTPELINVTDYHRTVQATRRQRRVLVIVILAVLVGSLIIFAAVW